MISTRRSPRLDGSASRCPRNTVARALGSGTEDYLKDVDEGDDTCLNAKKWKFASFFNRVKQQVRDHWKPAEAYHRRDPTGAGDSFAGGFIGYALGFLGATAVLHFGGVAVGLGLRKFMARKASTV